VTALTANRGGTIYSVASAGTPLTPEPLPAPLTPGLQPRPHGRLESLPGDPQDLFQYQAVLHSDVLGKGTLHGKPGPSPSCCFGFQQTLALSHCLGNANSSAMSDKNALCIENAAHHQVAVYAFNKHSPFRIVWVTAIRAQCRTITTTLPRPPTPLPTCVCCQSWTQKGQESFSLLCNRCLSLSLL
jgi:hypothetical protein